MKALRVFAVAFCLIWIMFLIFVGVASVLTTQGLYVGWTSSRAETSFDRSPIRIYEFSPNRNPCRMPPGCRSSECVQGIIRAFPEPYYGC